MFPSIVISRFNAIVKKIKAFLLFIKYILSDIMTIFFCCACKIPTLCDFTWKSVCQRRVRLQNLFINNSFRITFSVMSILYNSGNAKKLL